MIDKRFVCQNDASRKQFANHSESVSGGEGSTSTLLDNMETPREAKKARVSLSGVVWKTQLGCC